MAINWTTNLLLPGSTDKVGGWYMNLRNALVASGFWRVRGSGDGVSSFQLMGQTAGLAGGTSFDVFTGGTNGSGWTQGTAYNGQAGSISNNSAWLILEEIASGRCLYIQRTTGGSGTASTTYQRTERGFSPAGVASTGATATVMPARSGTPRVFATINADTAHWTNMDATSSTEFWQHIGVTDSVRSGNVAPFFCITVSRANGAGGPAMMHESLTDAPAAETGPYWHATGAWGDVWGAIGGGGGVMGSSYGVSGTAAATSRSDQINSLGSNLQTAGVYAPIDTDGRWRTQRINVRYTANRGFVGRTEHLLYNLVGREYPATYGVATATPYVAASHFLLPWKTGTVPNFTP